MTKICDINAAAKQKLPPAFSDKSGIGVHYTDAFIKPMNTKLPDGTREPGGLRIEPEEQEKALQEAYGYDFAKLLLVWQRWATR